MKCYSELLFITELYGNLRQLNNNDLGSLTCTVFNNLAVVRHEQCP